MALHFGGDDLVSMLSGPLGLCMKVAGRDVRGFYDDPREVSQDAMGEPRNIDQITVVIKTGAVPVAFDDTLVVDGLEFRVRNILPTDDGALTRLVLARVRV